jgi:hypothetical protein
MFLFLLYYLDKKTVTIRETKVYRLLAICLFAFLITSLTVANEEMLAVPIMFGLINHMPQLYRYNEANIGKKMEIAL